MKKAKKKLKKKKNKHNYILPAVHGFHFVFLPVTFSKIYILFYFW